MNGSGQKRNKKTKYYYAGREIMTAIIYTRIGLSLVGLSLYYHYARDTCLIKRTSIVSDLAFTAGLVLYCIAPVL